MMGVKLAIGAAVLGLLLWFGSAVKSWRHDALLLPAAQAATVQVQTDFNDYRRNMAKEVTRLATVSQGYSNELTTLRNDRARPVTLRVCGGTAAPAAAVHPASAAGVDAAVTAAGLVPGAATGDRAEGVDVGPELEQLARDADAVTALARGLQAYVATLPAACMIGATGS